MRQLTQDDPSTATSKPPAKSARRRWRPQFGLRLLVLLMVFATLPLWFWVAMVRPYHEQQQLARDLELMVQEASFSQTPGNVLFEPRGPEWLRTAAPDFLQRYFDRITIIHCNSAALDNQLMSRIRIAHDLEELHAGGSNITDEGLKALAHKRQLRSLWLSGTQITDDGLKRLAVLKNLEVLSLADTAITDHGLRELRSLPSLKTLDLRNNRWITDEGLAHVAHCKQLQVLSVIDTNVTDAGLRHLIGLKKLEQLYLDGNLGITNQAINFAYPLRLKHLGLTNTSVDADRVAHWRSPPE